MKIIRGSQSENQLGGWYRIFGDTSLRHDCQIAFQNSKIFKAIQFFGLCPYFKSKVSSLLCYSMRYCIKTFDVKIANNWSLWLPANKHFCEKRFRE